MQEKVIQQNINLLTLKLMPGPQRPLVRSHNIQVHHRNSIEVTALQDLHVVLPNLWFIEGKKEKVGMKPVESPDACARTIQ